MSANANAAILRFHNYMKDVDAAVAKLQQPLSDDDRSRAERADYRAPAFNALTSTRIVMLATLESSRATIDQQAALE